MEIVKPSCIEAQESKTFRSHLDTALQLSETTMSSGKNTAPNKHAGGLPPRSFNDSAEDVRFGPSSSGSTLRPRPAPSFVTAMTLSVHHTRTIDVRAMGSNFPETRALFASPSYAY